MAGLISLWNSSGMGYNVVAMLLLVEVVNCWVSVGLWYLCEFYELIRIVCGLVDGV